MKNHLFRWHILTIWVGLSIILGLSIYGITLTISTFSDGITSKNLTFTGNENLSFAIDFPRYGYVRNYNFIINGYNIFNYSNSLYNSSQRKFTNISYSSSGSYVITEQNIKDWINNSVTSISDTASEGDRTTNYTYSIDSNVTGIRYSWSVNRNGANPRQHNWSWYQYNNDTQSWHEIYSDDVTTSAGAPGQYDCVIRSFLLNQSLINTSYDRHYIKLNLFVGDDGVGGSSTGLGDPCDGYDTKGSTALINFRTYTYQNVENISVYIDNNILYSNTSIISGTHNISLNITTVNNLLSSSCSCSSCSIIGDYCRINHTVHSDTAGILNLQIYNLTYEYGVDNCSNSYGIPSNATTLNFSIFDENTFLPLSVNVSAELNITEGSNTSTYLFNRNNINNFLICIYPSYANLTLYMYAQYGGAKRERYYIENLDITNSTAQVNMYNFNDGTGLSDAKIIGYNYYYFPYQNVIGKLLRYYPSLGMWYVVQIDKADDNGVMLFYVYQLTTDYKFIWEYDGSMIDSTNPIKFVCESDTDCEESFVIEADSSTYDYAGMSYSYTYNNVTGIITFTYTDSKSLVRSVRLLVQQSKSSGEITICDETISAAAGTMYCNISSYTGVITIKGIRSASPDDIFFVRIIEKVATALKEILAETGHTNDGIFFSFLLMIGIASIGMASAPIAAILGALALIIVYVLGIASFITLSFVISGILVAIIVAVMVKR